MYVSEIMSESLVTVHMDDPLSTVKDIFDNAHFHHLLVVDNGKLQGVISDRDLLKVTSPKLGSVVETNADLAALNKKAHQIMSRNPVVLGPEATFDEAIAIFLEHNFSCIPVVSEASKPLGVVSWRDILGAAECKRESDNSTLEQTIESLARAGEKRDPYTAGHMLKVAQLSVKVGEAFNFSRDRLEGLRLGASIHDIGKISVPVEILSRPGRLSKWEFGMIKDHAINGYDIVKDIRFDWPVKEIVRQHHERIDGSGYPDGLEGSDILLESKIVAVADTYDAITSHRPYRAARSQAVAIKILSSERGVTLDSKVVDVFLKLLSKGVIE